MEWDRDGVPFAIDVDGNFRDVAEVPRGLKCGCYCADCKGPLVAKKGEVKAHHFAHNDRRECRHALESSLFGMLMTLVRSPEAALMVPPCGERRQLVPHPEQVFTDAQAEAFFRTPWVIEAALVPLEKAELAECDINRTSVDRPEISVAELDVHVLSHRKREADVVARIRPGGPAVLLLDLRDYAAMWWSVCDEHKHETIEAAKTATGVLTSWLRQKTSGRSWLFHPQLEARKLELRTWIAEKSGVAAQWRLRQRLMKVPKAEPPNVEAPGRYCSTPTRKSSVLVSTLKEVVGLDGPRVPKGGEINESPVGFVRPVKDVGWLTTHMAAECGLWRDCRTGAYVFLGRPGDPVPLVVRDMLDPHNDWQPVSAAEAVNFVSAKQLLRQAIAPYGLPPQSTKSAGPLG
jgi:hypothetical protein